MRLGLKILVVPMVTLTLGGGYAHAEGATTRAPSAIAQGPGLERHAENTYRPRQELLRRGMGVNHGFSFIHTEESLAEAIFTHRGVDLRG